MIILIIPKSIAINVVFLNERFSCKADKPGNTKRAITRITPTTFIESTIVIATNKSNANESERMGVPINLVL